MANPGATSPQRFLEEWEFFTGPLLDGPYRSDLELIRAMNVQEAALRAYAEDRPFPDDELTALRRRKSSSGQEHEVFAPDKADEDSVVWKITRPGRWGLVRATPREYLRRLHRLNVNSGTNMLVEGIAIVENNAPVLVTTMEFVPGKHPNGMYLKRRLQEDGWEPVHDPDAMLAYRLVTDGTLMRDAHPRNFILTSQDSLVPIDVIFEGEGKFRSQP